MLDTISLLTMPEPKLNPQEVLDLIRSVLSSESNSIAALAANLPDSCQQVAETLFNCQGRVIVTGMGKMSSIARKTAATLSSIGTPAVFLHPTEALHGDLGIVTAQDVLLALSNSGETKDVLEIVPFMKRQNVPVISITGTNGNSLAESSEYNIPTGVTAEADDITDAPTNSTTTTLAICDSLAIALVHLKGFTAEQFAVNHPGGKIGRKLLLRVEDLMASGDSLPFVEQAAALRDAIVSISKGQLGAGFVVDNNRTLLGIVTDGDLRRVLEHDPNPLNQKVAALMTTEPKTLSPGLLAVEALTRMNEHSITVMPVVDANNQVIGALHLHELLKAGLG